MQMEPCQFVTALRKLKHNAAAIPALLLLCISSASGSDVIFEESFDQHPDYTSSEELTLEGWSFRRHGEVNWSPENGHPDRHDAFEILDDNRDKARGGTGKSYVAWRESYDPGWKRWNSDGILAKHFEDGVDQLYVSFYIRFGENWTPSGSSKLFRVYSWNEQGSPFKFFSGGNAGPAFIWDYNRNNYGLRNVMSFRGGPHGEFYDISGDDIEDLPRGLHNLGDVSLNFTTDTKGMGADAQTPKIVDQVNGGFISDNMNQTVTHKQILGGSDHWTKVAFFIKMNSAPGANDGVVIQWINDEQVFVNRTIKWVEDNAENKMVDWNVIAIGGNDFFQHYPNSDRREEWYSIDDLMVATEIPMNLRPDDSANDASPPNPPMGLSVQKQ